MDTEPRQGGERATRGVPFDVLARAAYEALPRPQAAPDASESTHDRSRFEVLGEISRDETSVLLRGRDLELNREVALKILEDRGRGVRRFLEEAQLGAQLQHPGILPVLGLGFLQDGRAYLALRRVEGETFADLLARDKGPQRLLPVLEQAANAVAFAHVRGVAHGSLGASSIVVGRHGRVVVKGWDAAIRTNGDRVPVRKDVRDLGALLERALDDGTNGDLATMTRRCRSEDPAERPRHAGEVARAIGAHLAGEEARTREAELSAARARADATEQRAEAALETQRRDRARRARKRTLLVASVLLLAVVVGGAGLAAGTLEERAAGVRADAEVAAALRQAGLHESAGSRAEAIAWARKAAILSRGGDERARSVLARLEEEARRRAEDEVLLARLEAIRQRQRFGAAESVEIQEEYVLAFRSCGVDVESLRPEEIVADFRARLDPVELATALEERAWYGGDLARTLEIARRVDPDPWRNAVRDAALRRDRDRLSALAASADVAGLPIRTVGLLGGILLFLGDGATAASVLTEAVLRHPEDAPTAALLAVSIPWKDRASGTRRLQALGGAVARYPGSGCLWNNLAHALDRKGRPDDALAAAGRSTETDPHHAGHWGMLGLVLARRKDLPAAEVTFRRALEHDPEDAVVRINLGVLLQRRGRHDEAREQLQRAVELDGESALAHSNLGVALAKVGRPEEALAAYRRAVDLAPETPLFLINLAAGLCDLGRHGEAVSSLRKATRLRPDRWAAHHDLGNALLHLERYVEALASLREAERRGPPDADTQCSLGYALLHLGQPRAALEVLKKGVEIDPEHVGSHLNRAVAFQMTGEAEEAVAACRRVLALEPGHREAGLVLAKTLRATGRAGEAATVLRKHLERHPEDAEAHGVLGVTYCDHLKDPARAIPEFEAAARLDPEDVAAHLNLGLALAKTGRLDRAIESYRMAVGVDPACARAHLDLGRALQMADRHAEAEEPLLRALRLSPDDVRALEALGIALLKTGRPEKAIQIWRRALWQQPDAFDLHLKLAVSLARAERFEEARAGFRRAHRLAPRNAGVLNNLAIFLANCPDETLRRPGEAVRLAEQAVAVAPRGKGLRSTLGLALYRAGRFQAAIDELERARVLRGSDDPGDGFLRAMACARLGRMEEAGDWLARAAAGCGDEQSRRPGLIRLRAEAEALIRR